jgi:hypothetical protein
MAMSAPHNNGMHPTANSVAFIVNHPARRVMPGVGRLLAKHEDEKLAGRVPREKNGCVQRSGHGSVP